MSNVFEMKQQKQTCEHVSKYLTLCYRAHVRDNAVSPGRDRDRDRSHGRGRDRGREWAGAAIQIYTAPLSGCTYPNLISSVALSVVELEVGRPLRVQFSNVRGHAALEGNNKAFVPVPLSRGVPFPWKQVLRLLGLMSLCPKARGEAK